MTRVSAALGSLWALANRRRKGGSRHQRLSTDHSFHLRALRLEPLEDRTLLSVDPVVEANPIGHTSIDSPITVQLGATACFLPVASYPSSYDLRNVSGSSYVTSVKNQGSYGTCWAFATYGSLESSILKAGGTTKDFSERNLAYRHGFDGGPGDGGNVYMSEAYLSRFYGPINESDDPYSDMGTPDYITGPVQYYVREMLRFNSDSEIKSALMTYGALDTAMHWDDAYYRQSDYTYYYGGTEGQNHDVTIVGWDDNKVTAGGTGAWLIKNSWGTTWWSWGGMSSDNGYFWLSYADAKGANSAESFNSAVTASTYTKAYYWDDFGDITQLNSPYAFNAFTASSNSQLKSVGFFTEADGANYTISVYDTFSGGTLSNLLGTVSGSQAYAGYHTVDLSTPISLASGNDFYVCLHLTSAGTYPMAFDYARAGYDSASTASAGQSYYSYNGTTWTDLTSFSATGNFCIKALVSGGSTAPSAPTLVSTSDTGMSSSDGITSLDNSASAKKLQFTVTGTVAGATVTIYAGGTAIGSAVATGTTTTVTTNGTYDLTDGSHTITARQTESGSGESPDSSSLVIYVDTVAPTATTPDLEDATDTGISCTDNLTMGVHPKFNGTASDPTGNSYASGVWKVVVNSDDGKSATDSESPFYEVTMTTFSQGDRTVTATAYDIAGNAYTTSALAVTVDQTMPTVTINQAAEQEDPTTSLPIHYTVIFSEKINNFDSTDLSGIPAGATVTITPVGTAGTTFDVVIDDLTADATLTLTMNGGLASDDAGNINMTATSTDNTVSFHRLPPVATVSLNTSSPQTNDVLVATATKTGYYDTDVTLTFVWTVNGVVKRTFISSTTLTCSFYLSNAGCGDCGDVVTVSITPSDEAMNGTTVTATATVSDTPPVATVSLDTHSPRTDNILTATATTFDADSDAVSLTYVWKVNGIAKQTNTFVSSLTDTFDLSVLGNGDPGDMVTVEVTPNDGTASGTMVADTATVVSSTRTWVGSGADNNWTTAMNWTDGIVPVAGDALVFDGTARMSPTNNFAADTIFSSITFTSGGFILSGNAVTLNPQGGTAIDNQTGENQVNLPLTLGSASTVAIAANSGLALGAAATINNNGYLLTCYDMSSSAAANQWLGGISGSGGFSKTGSGALGLGGTNSYTGMTTLNGGTLTFVGPDAYTNVLNPNNGGIDLQSGSLVFDYTGASDPVAAIRANLAASYAAGGGELSSGSLYTSTGAAAGYGIGYNDDSATQTVTARIAMYGDMNLDDVVNSSDLLLLINNFGTTSGAIWTTADVNYDGAVNSTDLLALINSFGKSMSSLSSPMAIAATDAVFRSLDQPLVAN